MLDHITLKVADIAKSKAFYDAALAPLGIKVVMDVPASETGSNPYLGYGEGWKPYFWIAQATPLSGPLHVAFAADSRRQVDDFYAAAIKAGAKDNGPPGLRALYHPTYYGAFVIDPDGHNIEAVCHKPDA
jgi:catechol 2,3-dioxygenase-like lactoylglutathione lyase family enzyme